MNVKVQVCDRGSLMKAMNAGALISGSSVLESVFQYFISMLFSPTRLYAPGGQKLILNFFYFPQDMLREYSGAQFVTTEVDGLEKETGSGI